MVTRAIAPYRAKYPLYEITFFIENKMIKIIIYENNIMIITCLILIMYYLVMANTISFQPYSYEAIFPIFKMRLSNNNLLREKIMFYKMKKILKFIQMK
jgi:hypothetical protein